MKNWLSRAYYTLLKKSNLHPNKCYGHLSPWQTVI